MSQLWRPLLIGFDERLVATGSRRCERAPPRARSIEYVKGNAKSEQRQHTKVKKKKENQNITPNELEKQNN